MTITNRQIISDALGMLGVLAETEVASAEQAQHGLRVLNSLMAEWGELGILPQYYAQTALSDVCPIPDSEEQTVAAALALRLSAFYKGADIALVAAIASRGYNRLLRTAIQDGMQESSMAHLPQGTPVADIFNG